MPYLESTERMHLRERELSAAQETNGIGPLWTAPMWLGTFVEQEHHWRGAVDRASRLGIPGLLLAHCLNIAWEFSSYRHLTQALREYCLSSGPATRFDFCR